MSKEYRYKAISNGTLSNPYRFVEAGQVVISPVPITAKWLVTLEEARRIPQLPITPYMRTPGSDRVNVLHAPAPVDPNYDNQIRVIRDAEDRRDGKLPIHAAPQTPAEIPLPVIEPMPILPGMEGEQSTQPTDAGKGTGDQDVLG